MPSTTLWRWCRPACAAALVTGMLGCFRDPPTGPVTASHRLLRPADTLPVPGTYRVALACASDARQASNVGFNVWDSGNRPIFQGPLRCDETVTVGPDATTMYYNINVYRHLTYLKSCDSPLFMPIGPGQYGCRIGEAMWAAVKIGVDESAPTW
jgi:hypothetical protein